MGVDAADMNDLRFYKAAPLIDHYSTPHVTPQQ